MVASVMDFQRGKQATVAEEDRLEGILLDSTFLDVFQNWLSTSVSQLDVQFEQCEVQLASLQRSVTSDATVRWDAKKVIERCDLLMSEKRLQAHETPVSGDAPHTELPDLIRLITCLETVKSQSFVSGSQKAFIVSCIEALRSVRLEPQELLFITEALQTKLKDDSNARGVLTELTNFQNSIEAIAPDIEQCEQLLESSIVNGEMGLAEDISKRQLEIYEHLLQLITAHYPIISQYYTESCNNDRRRRWTVFRSANRDVTSVVEAKQRLIEACASDLEKLEGKTRSSKEDEQQLQRQYEAERARSDHLLLDNKAKQQGVWNRMFELFKEVQSASDELASLARSRRQEVNRRLMLEEREAGRRGELAAFADAAAEHALRLQEAMSSAQAAKDVAEALNQFVLDGCGSIAAKHDKEHHALGEMLRLVRHHHYRRFCDYYIAASRYLYRLQRRLERITSTMEDNRMRGELRGDTYDPGAKPYAEENGALALEHRAAAHAVLHAEGKLEKAERAIETTLRAFDVAHEPYVHPRVIVAKMNEARWDTMLNYRALLHPTETQQEVAVQDEAAAVAALRAQRESVRVGKSSARQAKQPAIVDGNLCSPPSSALAADVQAALSKPLITRLPQISSARAGGENSIASRPALAATTSRQRGGGNALREQLAPLSTSRSSVDSTAADKVSTAAAATAPARPGTSPSSMEGKTLRALFHYKARAPDELTFAEGDRIVCITASSEEGWFKGVCNQRTGLFPINFVTLDEGEGE